MDTDLVVFLAVVAVRVLLPLLIFKYPLPAIVLALVADAVDQTVFQQLAPGIDISESGELNYQGYDKALDIYYLTIAYLATFRNWLNPVAVMVAAFLWYYRLLGVTLFEMTGWRALLITFPNTFEYYFIFIALVRVGWRDSRLSSSQVIKAAASIWIFIKLPQEYWLHIAQLDVTEQLAERPWLWGVLVAALVVIGYVGYRVWQGVPPRDHPLTFDADKVSQFQGPRKDRRWSEGLLEKILLMSMITIIFTKAVRADTSNWEIIVGVVVVVVGNAGVTHWLRGRGRTFGNALWSFLGSLGVNAGVLLALIVFAPGDGDTKIADVAFFLALISLIISLFDYYHRPFEDVGEVGAEVPANPVLA